MIQAAPAQKNQTVEAPKTTQLEEFPPIEITALALKTKDDDGAKVESKKDIAKKSEPVPTHKDIVKQAFTGHLPNPDVNSSPTLVEKKNSTKPIATASLKVNKIETIVEKKNNTKPIAIATLNVNKTESQKVNKSVAKKVDTVVNKTESKPVHIELKNLTSNASIKSNATTNASNLTQKSSIPSA